MNEDNEMLATAQPRPWHVAPGRTRVYDANGDLVADFGNEFNPPAVDAANAALAVGRVNCFGVPAGEEDRAAILRKKRNLDRFDHASEDALSAWREETTGPLTPESLLQWFYAPAKGGEE